MQFRMILSEFWTGLRRNWALSVSVIIVIFFSLLFIGSAFLFGRQTDLLKNYWYDKIEVTVWLCSSTDRTPTCPDGEVREADKQAIEAELRSPVMAQYIDKVEFESKEQAYDRFREQFKGMAIADSVQSGQLPSSFRIKLKDPEKFQVISDQFKGRTGVYEVGDEREMLNKLFAMLNKMALFAVLLAAVMVVTAVLLIFTTIRLSVFNRRREIAIMRLVGASSTVVMAPFLLETLFAAVIGTGLAAVTLIGMIKFGVPSVKKVLPMNYLEASEVFTVLPLLFLVALVLSGVSTLIAAARYLRV